VDAHNPHFIGRGSSLRTLRENFVKPGHIGVVTAVNGIGGLGKTALAIEYAHAFADEYGGGRWQVRCAGKDDLRLALSRTGHAHRLRVHRRREEGRRPPVGAHPAGVEEAGRRPRTAPLPAAAGQRGPPRAARPRYGGAARRRRLAARIVATTRLGENELFGTHRDRSFLAVDELPPEDALALIESYQPGRASFVQTRSARRLRRS
jgi:hypothetical protein